MFLFLTFCVFALFSCRLFLLISVGGGRWQTRGVASVKDGCRGGRDVDDFFGGDEGKGMEERGGYFLLSARQARKWGMMAGVGRDQRSPRMAAPWKPRRRRVGRLLREMPPKA